MRYEIIHKIYLILANEITPNNILNNDKFYYDWCDESIRYVVALQSGLYLIRFNNGVGIIFDSVIKDKWTTDLYLLQFDGKTVSSIEVD